MLSSVGITGGFPGQALTEACRVLLRVMENCSRVCTETGLLLLSCSHQTGLLAAVTAGMDIWEGNGDLRKFAYTLCL